MHKGSMGKGAPGKMSRMLQLREIRCKHNMTTDDQRRMEHDEMCSRYLSGRGKREKNT